MKMIPIDDIYNEAEVPSVIIDTFIKELGKRSECFDNYYFSYFGEVGCDIPEYGSYDIGYFSSIDQNTIAIMSFDWDKGQEIKVIDFQILRE